MRLVSLVSVLGSLIAVEFVQQVFSFKAQFIRQVFSFKGQARTRVGSRGAGRCRSSPKRGVDSASLDYNFERTLGNFASALSGLTNQGKHAIAACEAAGTSVLAAVNETRAMCMLETYVPCQR